MRNIKVRFTPSEAMTFYVGMRDINGEKIDTRKKRDWQVDRKTAEFLLTSFSLNWECAYNTRWIDRRLVTEILAEHDVCFQVWNRPEWTEKALIAIDKNTEWDLVNKFYIMDDSSEKETAEILEKYENPKKVLVHKKFGGALASLKTFAELAETKLVFNLENDVLVPLNWNLVMAKEFYYDSSIGIIKGMSQDLPGYIYWNTALAGFNLECLKELLAKMGTTDRWIKGGWAKILDPKWRIHSVPTLFFDKLDYHEEEFPLIDHYYEKGWSKCSSDMRYRKRTIELFERRPTPFDMDELIDDGKFKVDGSDMKAFIALLAGLVIAQSASTVLEVGTGLLNSSKAFLYGLERTGGKLVTCDPKKRWDNFVHPQIEYHQEKSGELRKEWKEPIDILFIDGDHSYASVKNDFEMFYPFVKEQGLVIFHDSNHKYLPGVKKAVGEVFEDECVQMFRFPKFPGLTVMQKNG